MQNFNLLESIKSTKIMESIGNLFNTPFGIITAILDLAIVCFLIYKAFKILKETRAWQLIKGILVLLLVTFVSELVNFKILNYILTSVMSYGVIMIIIIFQPELRRALEQLGTNKFKRFLGIDEDIKIKNLDDKISSIEYSNNIKYNEEQYVIEGLPETVDVTLIGNKQNVYLAKQYPAEEVIVDLSDLTPGTHKVSLDYKQNVSSVTYKVDPSTVTVVVHKKISETREVSSDIIHKDKLDTKLDIKSVTLSKDRVTIKGPEYKLNQVASVKALIDIENLTNQKEGTQTLSDVQLVAYDNTGNIVEIEIGYRHHDIFQRFKEDVSRHPQDQGFYTSKGRFVNRKEALEIAIKAQQVKEDECGNTRIGLFSEDLY